jgi:hypothetical protein
MQMKVAGLRPAGGPGLIWKRIHKRGCALLRGRGRKHSALACQLPLQQAHQGPALFGVGCAGVHQVPSNRKASHNEPQCHEGCVRLQFKSAIIGPRHCSKER